MLQVTCFLVGSGTTPSLQPGDTGLQNAESHEATRNALTTSQHGRWCIALPNLTTLYSVRACRPHGSKLTNGPLLVVSKEAESLARRRTTSTDSLTAIHRFTQSKLVTHQRKPHQIIPLAPKYRCAGS